MIDSFISKLARWSAGEKDIRAVALVGSQARGTAAFDSDIDLVIICPDPSRYLESKDWLSHFGRIKSAEREDWGLVRSWRVFYWDGNEVEFGLTTEQWCSESEFNSGTGRVISDGAKIVFDPHSLLADLIAAIDRWQSAQMD